MRASAALLHSPPVTKIANPETAAAAKAAFAPGPTVEHMQWHSPVPYLFGGLAAMLGLIAFALLILACSYWNLSGEVSGGEGEAEGGGSAAKGDGSSDTHAAPPFEEKFLVIMAGDARPTFLATPTSNRRPCLNDDRILVTDKENGEELREIQLDQVHVQP